VGVISLYNELSHLSNLKLIALIKEIVLLTNSEAVEKREKSRTSIQI
jgi:hypothetical protein